ncbi:MAG: hypothetical protein HUU13_18060, partial [Burkholderiaceae bacterium]|nr:hypothetical protein [Burkholderiaceae bacterium]
MPLWHNPGAADVRASYDARTMPFRTPRSLHLRLWVVIAMASLPVFLMAFFDYRERRQDAIAGLENEVTRMLTAARLTEDAA